MMQSLSSSSNSSQSWLIWFLRGLLILGFLFLFSRLFELQIIKGSYFRLLADGNRIRKIPIVAARGEIKARGGETLVGNKEVKKRIIFDPNEGYITATDFENAKDNDEIITEWRRNYDLATDFAHVGGYLGEVTESESDKVDPQCPEKGPRKSGSLVGRGGLEEEYDCRLRGIDGVELVEIDSMGKKVRILGKKDPIAGETIITTIDISLQKKVSRSIAGTKDNIPNPTAAVLTNAKGEVLALASYPTYNPNVFLEKDTLSRRQIASLLTDPKLPLFNRVIGGTYHPGSTFKIVTSIAALEEEKIDENFLYEDKGVIRVGDFSYYSWNLTQYGKTEGLINLVKAIARSTDTFFYKIGEMVGANTLAVWSNKFGLEKKSGIDLPAEVEGLIPTPEWKKINKGEAWFLGNTYHMAIGQGDVSTTPLSVNLMTSVIANKGIYCKPHILAGDDSCHSLEIKKENVDLVKKGMVAACSNGGTGYPFFDFSPQVACKTGTAEIDENGNTHAWFTVMAPSSDPEIVLTIVVEKGGEGSKVAAPIARDILNYWRETKAN